MDEYFKMKKDCDNYKTERKSKYLDNSKKRLTSLASQKIQTTMIGALASIEEYFGDILDDDPEMFELYQKVRKDILDKGNKQIKNLQTEMEYYKVEWLRYQMKLPVRKINKEGQEND